MNNNATPNQNASGGDLSSPLSQNKKLGAGLLSWLAYIKNEYLYLLMAAAIPAILFFLIYLVRGLYPFGQGTVLVLDLNGQYVFFFEGLKNAVLEGDSLLYTWSRALGGEFLGMYAYYIASPLSYLICLFPADRTQEFLLIMFMIKAALCGLTMGFYLHKHSVKRNKFTVVAFSILYAMSAYCVVHQNNTMWIDAVMWLPLVAYGIEQLIKYGKYKVFVIFLALTLASNFYIGYMVCIFVFLYYFFYLFAYKDNGVNNPRSESAHFGKSFVRIGFFSLLAIGIAALIVLGAYYSLQFGKNEFTDPSWDVKLRFDFYDLLFKLLPSSYDTVRIDGLPFVYCGLLTVILAPLFFCSKKFTVREKIVSGIFLLIFVLSFMISTVDLVWHGFQKPQWLNNRYSFMFCFFLIFLAFRAFEFIEEISLKNLAVVGGFIFLFTAVLQKFAEEYKDKLVELAYGPNEEDFLVHPFATVLLTVIALVIYISLITLMKRADNKDLVSAGLVGAICIELFISGLNNINDLDKDVGYGKYTNYNEFKELYTPIVETLDSYDTSFYRFEKTYHRKYNDNMGFGIRGLSNSTSTLNKDTVNFLRMMGYYSQSHKSQYKGGNPVGDSLVGIKYIISERDLSTLYGEPVLTGQDYADYLGITLDELKEQTFADNYKDLSAADINVYLNKWALSLAFAADDDIYNVNFKEHNTWISESSKDYAEKYNPYGHTNPFARMNALITAILGEDETVELFKPAIQNGEPKLSDGVTFKVSSDHNKYVGTDQKGTVTYSYTVPEGQTLYLYFPAYYNREIKISSPTLSIADGTTKLDKCNDRIVELGACKGTEYKLKVTISNTRNEFYTKLEESFIYYVDTDVMNEVFTRIQEGQMIMDDTFKSDDITGTMTTAKDGQTVLTSIPYDKGWRVYVDGEEVQTYETLDALVSFKIDEAGEHDIRFLYRSDAYNFGIVITIVSLSGFILIMIFERWLKKLKLVKLFFVVEGDEDDESLRLAALEASYADQEQAETDEDKPKIKKLVPKSQKNIKAQKKNNKKK
ncbi:MAG: YfhO family protein [Clostridia bacterium]|nr:YfhO family protein [Clostridia bacterium]